MIGRRELRQDFGAVLLVGNAVDGIREGAIVIVRAQPRFEGPFRPVVRYVAENGVLPVTLNHISILKAILGRIVQIRWTRGLAVERNRIRNDEAIVGVREYAQLPVP